LRCALLAPPGSVAVEPVTDRPPGQSKIATDLAEGHTFGAELEGALAKVGWVHTYI
jgi:hypothetical protein